MKPNNHPEPPRQFIPSSGENIRVVPIILDGDLETKRPASVIGHGRPRQLSGIREASESRASEPDKPRPLFQDKSGETETSSQGKFSDNPFVGHDGPPPPVPLHRLHGHSSTVSLPLASLPERRSSRRLSRRSSEAFLSSEDFPSLGPPPPKGFGQTIPRRGQSSSPVRAAAQYGAVSSDTMRKMPSRTFVRSVKPTDILEVPAATHPRVQMNLHVAAPLFVGGGTIEGQIQLTVDSSMTTVRKKIKRIMIARVSIDMVGVEELSDGRHWIFLSLASELVDERHPPPSSLITSPNIVSQAEPFWVMKSASANLPFRLNLPLNIGPPPYNSKHARIRYVLCSTALIKVNGKQHIVRQSRDIAVLTVFDPERALASLPSPLIASDEMQLPGIFSPRSVKLTAGLHRQTWVDGANIFIDVHVLNNSSKVIKRLEVQLEKMTLFFAYPAAGTVEKAVQHLRLPSRSENELIAKMILKKDKIWNGVQAKSSEVRTCELEVPKGHVTITTGRYFEVRYFLNVSVTVSMFKILQVQLPVTLIHMNSLDIVPNSIAQVTAAIAEKRSRTGSHRSSIDPPAAYTQGQAFTASRRQSLSHDAGPIPVDEIEDLRRELDDSPRKNMRTGMGKRNRMVGHRQSSTGLRVEDRAQSYNGPHCYRRHASFATSAPRLPRIQISTSGLGFSGSDFEISPVRPTKLYYNDLVTGGLEFQRRRKGPLSEKERRDVKLQQELSGARKRSREGQAPWGWRNVAAEWGGGIVIQTVKGKGRAVWGDQ